VIRGLVRARRGLRSPRESLVLRRYMLSAVIRREWREILRNRLLLASILIPPVLLAVVPLIVVSLAGSARNIPVSAIAEIVQGHSAWADLSQSQVVQAFALQQFLVIFLLLPGYIPLAIASYSIVGEKQTRSLEAVLATPIRTTELLAGKAIASVVPAIVVSWTAYGAVLVLSAFLLGPRLTQVMAEPAWIGAVGVFGPAIGLASVTAGLLVSSRVNDPRAAQQIGAVILLPIISITVIQATGNFLIDFPTYVLAGAVTFLISLVGLRAGSYVFGRETILTRWK
jgi:ABC-2 type transport system permease protein